MPDLYHAQRAMRNMRRAAMQPTGGSGPERERWDAVFTPELMDRLNTGLVALPGSTRQRRRRDIFAQALCALPDGFPRTGADDDALRSARDRLAAAAAAL